MSITTSDYLNQLKEDKKQLVQSLIEKEIDASYDETFTELVPKIKNISNDKINGIIEQYTVAKGQKINAGDFVEFINSYTTDKIINNNTISNIDSVILDNNKIFITYVTESTDYFLYGMICEVNENTIIPGTSIQLSNNRYSGRSKSMTKINENQVFITHSSDLTSSTALYGMICNINDSSIEIVEDKMIVTGNVSYTNTSSYTMDENKIIISYAASGYYLGILVCQIENSAIINTISNTYSSICNRTKSSIEHVTGNKFIVMCNHSDRALQLMIVSFTVNRTSIVFNDFMQLSASGDDISAWFGPIKLKDDLMFIIYGAGRYQAMYGFTITISNDLSIEQSNKVELDSADYSGNSYNYAVALNREEVLIIYKNLYSTGNLMAMTCKFFDGTIMAGNSRSLIVQNTSSSSGNPTTQALKFQNKNILILHNFNDKYLHGLMRINQIQKYSNRIDGIAKNNAISNNKVQIYIQN